MPNDYTGKQIVVLEGLEPVRKRPAMYIGSTDFHGVHHCITEIVDNCVDEALAGFAKNVWVTIHKDETVEVSDDGRGIPVDIMPQYKKPALEVVMTKLHAGGKFEGQAYKVSGGLHGVGASVVNALSEWLKVEVKRDGKIYSQEYKRGIAKTPVKELTKGMALVNQNPTLQGQRSGTTTLFLLDKEIFKDYTINYEIIKRSLRERAYLVSKLFFHLKDERTNESCNFYFEGGIVSLVEQLNENKDPLHPAIFIQKVTDHTEIQVAIQYNDGFNENVESFVNVINTKEGGTHLTGFKMALTRAINDYGKKIGAFKNGDETVVGDDTREGLTAVVYIKMPSQNLQFEGQTKGKLGNAEVQPLVQTAVKEGLDVYFEEHPSDGKKILEKVFLASKARLAAKAAKDAVLRKGALEGSALPGKLADCQEKDPAISELYIVEGDSAGGCWDGDTKVALADGRNLSFKELQKEEKEGKQNYGYTILNNGHIGIAPITNIRITKKNAALIKVVLDNNEELICTPDHPFRLVDGSYIQAEKLTSQNIIKSYSRKIVNNKVIVEEVIEEESNHKIKYIEILNEKRDVYDLEIPETHNFALSAGIFVHNSAKMGRDRKFQAILPLGGKILNTERARLDKIIQFEELKDLIIALGMGIGESLNPEKLRYHRIVIMCDADVDGEHIATLLLTFFYRHLPSIVQNGYLYIALPPLYKIPVGKNIFYAYNDDERDVLLKEHKNEKIGNIQRYKGLGEMNPDQLWETTMNPANRTLKKVNIEDAVLADKVFSMLMGDEVPPRKRFIQTHAKKANLDI